jgi:hypothetical protein
MYGTTSIKKNKGFGKNKNLENLSTQKENSDFGHRKISNKN